SRNRKRRSATRRSSPARPPAEPPGQRRPRSARTAPLRERRAPGVPLIDPADQLASQLLHPRRILGFGPNGQVPGEIPQRLAVVVHLKVDHAARSEEHTSELQSPCNLVCRLLLEK